MPALPDVTVRQGRSAIRTAEADCVLLAATVPQLGCSRATNRHGRVSPNALPRAGTQHEMTERMNSRLDAVLQFQNHGSG